MDKTRRAVQLVITVEDKPGMLADISTVLAKEHINIEAINAYGDEGEAIFYIIVRDHEQAKKALKAKGWDVKEEEIIVLDLANKPGNLNEVALKLQKLGVNLRYCYGTTSASGPSHFVLKATDNDLAAKALKD